VRKQYHFQKSPQGLLSWDVDRLVFLSKDFPVKRIPLNEIEEMDEPYWFDSAPACRQILDHIILVNDSDLAYPIILNSKGRVMDGMHRVLKALLEGRQYIDAVQFDTDPLPDYVGIAEKDLPY